MATTHQNHSSRRSGAPDPSKLPTELNLLVIPSTPATLVGAYVLGERIGSGSFATVFKGHHHETFQTVNNEAGSGSSGDTNQHTAVGTPGKYGLRYSSDGMPMLVAIKSVDRSRLDHRLAENLESEIRILRTLRHPNIVALWGTEKTDKQIHLLMEYCELGDLSDFIKKKGLVGPFDKFSSRNPFEGPWGGLDENVARWFLGQLGSALTFLRTHNLIHRDLKPQNLLLSSRPGTYGSDMTLSQSFSVPLPTLKLADFGFARLLPSMSLASTLCGSPLYMAPEILRHERYDAKADLWSVGIVLYEMVAGRVPFRARNHVELLKRIESGKSGVVKWPDEQSLSPRSSRHAVDISPSAARQSAAEARIGDDIKDLVQKLLRRDPTDRMTFDEFFSHPAIVESEGFSGRLTMMNSDKSDSPSDDLLDDNDAVLADELSQPAPKKHIVVPRRASTSLAEERAALSRGLAQLVPSRKSSNHGASTETASLDSPGKMSPPITVGSAPVASKPVPVPVVDTGDDYQTYHPPSAPNDLPFAFPVATNRMMFGPIGVPSSSFDTDHGFPEELERRPTPTNTPPPSSTGFGGLGALQRNVSAPKNIVTAHYRRASSNETVDDAADSAKSQPRAGAVPVEQATAVAPFRRPSHGLGEAVIPPQDTLVRGVVTATSTVRRGSSGNIPKAGSGEESPSPDGQFDEGPPEAAGYIINHNDDDLPPRSGSMRTSTTRGVAIPRAQAVDPTFADAGRSPSTSSMQSRSPRGSFSRPQSQGRTSSTGTYGRHRSTDFAQDPDEYVVISKRAVEVEWLADEVESFARSPRSQPSSMDRVPHFLAAMRPRAGQHEASSPASFRPDITPSPPNVVPKRSESSSGQLSLQEDGHPIVARLRRMLDRGYALQRLADEYLISESLDTATAEIPLQLYLHALHVLQKGVDTARVGFDTFKYAQNFAAVASPYGSTPPSSTPPGRSGRMLPDTMRNSPMNADSHGYNTKDVTGEVNKLAELVRLTRDAFTGCLVGAEKCREIMESAPEGVDADENAESLPVEKVIYERVLELGRSAAMRELSITKTSPARTDVLLECETIYTRGIVLLEALLDETDGTSSHQSWDVAPGSVNWILTDDDRRMVTEFLASLHMRVAALKIKMMS